ncbi:MAG TPA: M3 family metallopeptidase, partial [Polyangiaceae bacterium]|nr:M3 family metallopeptidase [Polyangiaceae bacterium]
EFEAQALKSAGFELDVVPPRYRAAYFSHCFSDALGYSAGYYSYIWSEVLARDTEAWFGAHGGLSRPAGDILRQQILAKGNSVDPSQAFQAFYGRAPDIEPLLEKRGLLP